MAKFIQVYDGTAVNTAHIEAINRLTDYETSIKMVNGEVYVAFLPYDTIKAVLERPDDKSEQLLEHIARNQRIPTP